MIQCCYIDEVHKFFSCGFSNGFGLYNLITGEKLSFTNTPYKSLNLISNLSDSNIIVLMHDGKMDVELWDRCSNSYFFSFLTGTNEGIKAIKLRPDVLFILTESSISAFNLFNQEKLFTLKTTNNIYGAFDVTYSYSSFVFAIPSDNVGSFAIINYLQPQKYISEIQASKKPIKVLKFSRNGKFIAVADTAGDKIMIFQVSNSKHQFTLTMPVGFHKIYNVSFNEWSNQLFVQTKTGTIYLYNVPISESLNDQDDVIKIKSSCNYSPGKIQFWASFGPELYDLIIIKENCQIVNCKYVKKTNHLEVISEKNF